MTTTRQNKNYPQRDTKQTQHDYKETQNNKKSASVETKRRKNNRWSHHNNKETETNQTKKTTNKQISFICHIHTSYRVQHAVKCFVSELRTGCRRSRAIPGLGFLAWAV